MSKAPEIIYHYTSAKVLKSILENKQLWASDVMYMNDAQELLFAKDETQTRIEARIAVMGTPQGAHDPLHSQQQTLAAILGELNNLGAERKYSYPRVYATCFCENRDLLSQWRGYAGNDGYAIGFRTELLGQIDNPMGKSMPMGLERIHYGISDAKKVLDAMINSIAQNVTAHPGVKGFNEFATEVVTRLATIKNPAFSEEAEWRLLAAGQDPRELSFRESNLGLVPYIKYELPYNAIAEICIGPGSNTDLRYHAIRQLIVKHQDFFKQVSISFTEASLRG